MPSSNTLLVLRRCVIAICLIARSAAVGGQRPAPIQPLAAADSGTAQMRPTDMLRVRVHVLERVDPVNPVHPTARLDPELKLRFSDGFARGLLWGVRSSTRCPVFDACDHDTSALLGAAAASPVGAVAGALLGVRLKHLTQTPQGVGK